MFVSWAIAAASALAVAGCASPVTQAQSLAGAPHAVAETGSVYTADERGRSISVIDLGTGQVKTVPIRIAPHNVQISRDGRLLLAVGMVGGKAGQTEMAKGANMDRGRLLVFDAVSLDAQSAANIEIGGEPAHVIVDPAGKLAYASNAYDNTLSVVDQSQRKVVTEIRTGKHPHGLRMSPDGREIYLANTGDDTVSVIDVEAAKEVARIPVGQAPAQVGFTPDGRRVYASSTVDDSVAVVDTKQRQRIKTIPVGRKPIQVFATPNGRYVYVDNEGTKENPGNRASVIEVATDKVVATVVTGRGAHGVVVSDDGSRAFIANTADGTVSEIDTATQRLVRSFKVGDGSGSITFRGAGR